MPPNRVCVGSDVATRDVTAPEGRTLRSWIPIDQPPKVLTVYAILATMDEACFRIERASPFSVLCDLRDVRRYGGGSVVCSLSCIFARSGGVSSVSSPLSEVSSVDGLLKV